MGLTAHLKALISRRPISARYWKIFFFQILEIKKTCWLHIISIIVQPFYLSLKWLIHSHPLFMKGFTSSPHSKTCLTVDRLPISSKYLCVGIHKPCDDHRDKLIILKLKGLKEHSMQSNPYIWIKIWNQKIF